MRHLTALFFLGACFGGSQSTNPAQAPAPLPIRQAILGVWRIAPQGDQAVQVVTIRAALAAQPEPAKTSASPSQHALYAWILSLTTDSTARSELVSWLDDLDKTRIMVRKDRILSIRAEGGHLATWSTASKPSMTDMMLNVVSEQGEAHYWLAYMPTPDQLQLTPDGRADVKTYWERVADPTLQN